MQDGCVRPATPRDVVSSLVKGAKIEYKGISNGEGREANRSIKLDVALAWFSLLFLSHVYDALFSTACVYIHAVGVTCATRLLRFFFLPLQHGW